MKDSPLVAINCQKWPILLFIVIAIIGSACQKNKIFNPMPGQIKIACVGNSITYGMNVENREENSYPARLNHMLGDQYFVANCGISGRTLLKNADLPYWNETLFQEAQELEPDIVIIKLGTNDAKGYNWKDSAEFVENYVEFINIFNALSSKPDIYICYPLPIHVDHPDIKDFTVKDQIIPKIDQVADQTNVKIIDAYSPFKDHPEWFSDGIHPNAEGANELAKVIYNALK